MVAPVSSSSETAWQAYDAHLLGSRASMLHDRFTGHLWQTYSWCLHRRKLLCFPYGNQTGSSHVSLYLDGNEAEQKLQGIRHTTFKLMIKNQLDPSRSSMKGKALPHSVAHNCALGWYLSSTSKAFWCKAPAPSIPGYCTEILSYFSMRSANTLVVLQSLTARRGMRRLLHANLRRCATKNNQPGQWQACRPEHSAVVALDDVHGCW